MPQAAVPLAAETVLASEVMATEAAAALAAEQATAAAIAQQTAAATAAATEAATATAAATTGAADLATQEAVRAQLAANAGQAGLPSIAPATTPTANGLQALEAVQITPTQPYPSTMQIGSAVEPKMDPNYLNEMLTKEAALKERLAAQTTALPEPNFVQSAMNTPVAEAPAAPGNALYQLQPPGYQSLNAPVDTTVPNQYSISGQNYNLAGSVPSGAATQTASGTPGMFDTALDYIKNNKMMSASVGLNALNLMNQKKPEEPKKYSGPLSKFKFNPSVYQPYEPRPPAPAYSAQYNTYAGGGPIEAMSNANALGENTGYPMADINKGAYATPYQTPISRNVVGGVSDTGVNPMTGEMQFASGGISSLGGYADYAGGGRMLKGPGDGMSDDIPATIANKQPARLANEEFVVPADVVSHLGNGSSEAGAKALYRMMDRVRQARTGTKKQGKQINPEKYLA